MQNCTRNQIKLFLESNLFGIIPKNRPAHEATCRRATAAKRQHAVAAESRAALDRTFSAYGEILKSARQFKYLGCIVVYDDNDTPAIRRNMKAGTVQEGVGARLCAAPRGGHVLSNSRDVGTAL